MQYSSIRGSIVLQHRKSLPGLLGKLQSTGAGFTRVERNCRTKMAMKKEPGSISVHDRRNWIRRLVIAGLALFLVLLATLTVVPAAFPSFGANMADYLRVIFGPQPVAKLESVSFKLHDEMNRSLYKDTKPQIAWNNSTQAGAFTIGGASKLASPLVKDQSPVVEALPQIGWQAYGPSVNGGSVLARTMLHRSEEHT